KVARSARVMPVEIGADAALISPLGRKCTPSTSAPVESIPLRKLRRLTFSIAATRASSITFTRSVIEFIRWTGLLGCSVVLIRRLCGGGFYRCANPLIGPAAADVARQCL